MRHVWLFMFLCLFKTCHLLEEKQSLTVWVFWGERKAEIVRLTDENVWHENSAETQQPDCHRVSNAGNSLQTQTCKSVSQTEWSRSRVYLGRSCNHSHSFIVSDIISSLFRKLSNLTKAAEMSGMISEIQMTAPAEEIFTSVLSRFV